ncbi:MAG: M23 family metallopeptidase [Candidatus Omnitrophica bacterium]|nr:M23 family metallopeptidase [Candidatus Omnitrophota bacterium]
MKWSRAIPWTACALSLVGGTIMGWAAQSLVYRDWRLTASPFGEDQQLLLRQDAKGDGRFGAPRSGHRRHRGIDLEAPVGSPVRAIRSGVVIATGIHRGLGRYLELEHRQGLRSLYGHLETTTVEVGDRVRQGQRIATVGKTGNAKHPVIKPHLHLEILRAGTPLDPATIGLSVMEPTSPKGPISRGEAMTSGQPEPMRDDTSPKPSASHGMVADGGE